MTYLAQQSRSAAADREGVAPSHGEGRMPSRLFATANATVLWQTPVDSNPGAWCTPQFACGDIDGDGVREWAFVRVPGELVVASHKGEQIARMTVSGRPDRIAIISLAQSKGMLVLLQNGVLSAFSA